MSFHAPSLLALVCGLLAGCGPTVQSMRFTPVREASRNAEHPIQIYRVGAPSCAFEELGLVTGQPSGLFRNSLDHVAEGMRKHARRMGGDAIVGLSRGQRDSGGGLWGISLPDSLGGLVIGTLDGGSASEFIGSVIRFTDPDCTR